jgi:hypothetical protein
MSPWLKKGFALFMVMVMPDGTISKFIDAKNSFSLGEGLSNLTSTFNFASVQ